MDAAFELTPLVAFKLFVYSLGALVHLFLMVLILGQRGLRRLEWLLFWLMGSLFMWNSGNLLALNVGLFYGVSPRLLAGTSRIIAFSGLMASAPLSVLAHAAYASRLGEDRPFHKTLVALIALPVASVPWMVARLLGHLELDSLIALGPWARGVALWLVAAQVAGAAFNVSFSVQRTGLEALRVRLHGWLAAFQIGIAAGLAWAYLFSQLPPAGLGGYFPTAVILLGVAPSALVGYWIFRYNFLNFRVQRNLVYSVVAIFAGLIYLNLMRRLSGYLELRNMLPAAVTEAVMIFLLVVFLEPVKKAINRALHAAFVSEFERVQKLAAEIQECAKQTGDVAALKRFLEERLPAELGFERVRLVLGDARLEVQDDLGESSRLRAFSIHRGGGVIGRLEVVPMRPELSGEQVGALELLADQLAAAIELCQLISAKVQLERALAEKAKMAFLGEMAARIAHNVKNPLGSMKTLVQLLEEDTSLPDRVRQDCRMVVGEIDRLNSNISQVLRYAKPARDTDRPADLAAVASRVLSLARADAERRKVRLELEALGPCPVEGGEEAASDIISNLLVNALEASPPGGTVTVRLRSVDSSPESMELDVEDRGPGISPELKEKIFQPFFTTRPGGTGLGLAIVARRVEEIGGSVGCVSPLTSDGGTRFRVRFRASRSGATSQDKEAYALRSGRG